MLRSVVLGAFVLSGCDALFGIDRLDPTDTPDEACTIDDDCVRGSETGTCRCGYCAFADPQCPTTNQRWGAGAELGLEGTCVPTVEQIDATVYHTCALMSDRTAWCWGWNDDGQLGTAQPVGVSSSVPVQVTSSQGVLADVVQIVAAGGSTCALRADTTVSCWGSNQFGQLGANLPTGAGTSSLEPVTVVTNSGPLTGVTKLAAGFFHVCAVAAATVYCWGDNSRSQSGLAASVTHTSIAVPLAPPGSAGVIDLAVGGEHACAAINTSGSRYAYCWGRTLDGRLGNNGDVTTDVAQPTPQMVMWQIDNSPLPDVTKLVAAQSHTCAIKNPPGELYCWGRNADGALGDGTTIARGLATRVMGSPGDYHDIDGGARHTCALLGDDTWCWGGDSDGRLGNGDADTSAHATPTKIIASDRMRDLTAGLDHTCALGVDRELVCWGANGEGQLGAGDTAARSSPTPIDAAAFCPRP